MQRGEAPSYEPYMMSLNENLLPDRFKVIGELGRGGTSVVYRALDSKRGHEVAVKVLLKDAEEDRFQREAERLAEISHPNVVAFLEVGRHEGRDFLVMEYLEMGDLTSYVQKLNVKQILRLFIQICDGLAHLHDKGIVHRDLKPANILVDRAGKPKIADLGVARQMERNTRLTQAGTILGTYSFLAPEQILSSTVGPKSDLYSLGICLFCALTGRKPFEADNEFTMLKAHLESEPPLVSEFLPGAPASLDQLVNHLLAKDEQDRPRSARAVADLLMACIEDLESQDQGDLQPMWEEKIEELHDDLRSVLLAVTYLGQEATFAKVCRATPFSEDKTDRCLEELLKSRLIDSPSDDTFTITFPQETIQTRLTPRIRKLFASRLALLADARDMSAETTPSAESSVLTIEKPEAVVEPVSEPAAFLPKTTRENPKAKESPESALWLKPSSISKRQALAKGGPMVDQIPEPQEPETIRIEKTKFEERKQERPAEAKSEPAQLPPPLSTSTSKPNWILTSLVMLALGVALAIAGQWYWAHSATLVITSQPAGARVLINGQERGVTPLEVGGLRPGEQAVAVSLENHRWAREKLELAFHEKHEAHYTLDPVVGTLLLTLEPRDASVSINGQVYGAVSSDLELAEGKHSLLVEKPGFEPYQSEIVISEEAPLEVEVSLKAIFAQVEVRSTPKGAEVSLDGNLKGKTPLTLEKVPYGEHEVALRLKGHERVLKALKVEQSKALKVDAQLKELPGALAITSNPEGAKIKLNGEVKGNTPQTITELKAGSYTLSLSRDGYLAVEEKVTVTAGEESKANFVLSRPQPVARPVSRPVSSRPANPYTPPPYSPPPSRPAPRPQPQPQPAGDSPWIVQ